MTTAVLPFLAVYGISYFFAGFGPNMTTFVLPGELYPASVRATGHGISALGFAVTLTLPEPAGRSLEEISAGVAPQSAAAAVVAAQPQPLTADR